MNSKMKRILCLSIMILMLTTGLLPFVPMVSALNDPPQGFGTFHVTPGVCGNKDWTVNDARSYVPTGGPAYTIVMDCGNIIIANGGSLTLDHITIQFAVGADGQHGIVVQAGGTLIMKNSTIVPTAASNPHVFFCGFLAGSTIKLFDSGIGGVGGKVVTSTYPYATGIYIATTNITTNKFTAIFNGDPANNFNVPLIHTDADGIVLKNITLGNIQSMALYTNRSTTLYDSVIQYIGAAGNSWYGIYVTSTTSIKMANDDISKEADGIYSLGVATIEKCRIQNNTATGIIMNGPQGILTLKNTEIPNNKEGIEINTGATATLLGNDRIYYNTEYGLSVKSMGYVNVTDARISFNGVSNVISSDGIIDMTKVTIEDATSSSYSLDLGVISQVTIKDSNIITLTTGIWENIDVSGGSHLNMTGTNVDGSFCGYVIVAETGADVELAKDTITGGWQSVTSTTGASVYSSHVTYKNFWYVFYTGVNGYISSIFDTGTSSVSSDNIVWAVDGSTISMSNADFTMSTNPNTIAWASRSASIYIYDSKFTTSASNPTLVADTDGTVQAISVQGIDPTLTQAKTGGTVYIGWHVNVKTQWQNSMPAPNALVEFNDHFGHQTANVITGDDGTGKTDVFQVTVTDTGTIKHNKYWVNASLNGMVGSTQADIIKNFVPALPIVITLTDDSAPDLSVTFPTDKWMTNTTKFTMNGTADDLGSMLDGVYVQVDSAASWTKATGMENWTYDLDLTEGTHMIKVEARDIAGLVKDKTINVTVDLTAPTITIVQPTTLYVTTHAFYLNGTTEANASVSLNGSAFSKTTDGKFSTQLNLPDGAYDIKVMAKDAVGNMATKTVSVIIDTVPPTLSSDTADQTWLATKQFTLTGKSDGNTVTVNGVNATVDKTNKTWKIALTLTEGANTLQVQAMDLAGNTNKLTLHLNVDTIPPTLTVTFPTGTGTYYTNKAAMNVTGKVTGANTLTLNGASANFGTDGNFTIPITLASGSNVITIVAKDLAGNQAKWNMTVVLDTVAPKVTITSPKDGLVTNVASQTVVGTVDDTTATIKMGTTNVANSNGAFSTPAALSAGANTITITATDLAGNVGKATITVTLKTSVALTITTPKSLKATTSTETTTIKGTAEAGATVTINDMNVPVDSSGAFSGKVTLKEGKNTFTIVAKDAAGNTQTQVVTVTFNDAKQYDIGTLLGLAIVLMIVGLIIGLVVGMVMARRKAKPPTEEETTYPKAPTKPAPEEEEKGFTPEEEPEEKPEPKVEPKPEPKPAPKPEPKPEPKVEPKAAPPKETPKTTTPAKDNDGSLEDLLKGLDKK